MTDYPPPHTHKHSSNAPKAYSDLQVALDRMLKVLKNLNDSLHVVGLKGFPVSVNNYASGVHMRKARFSNVFVLLLYLRSDRLLSIGFDSWICKKTLSSRVMASFAYLEGH